MPRLETERLIVLPFTLDLKRLALRDRAGLASRIDAGLPDEWPNPDYAEVLPFLVAMAERDPARDDGAWSGLILHRVDRVVIGEMGCKGGPDAAGTVEIGYGIIPAYRGQGYATEAVGALVDWAVRRPG